MNRVLRHLAVAYCALLTARATAQAPSGAPDVLILVQPSGSSALVTLTYPKVVPHPSVGQRFEKLAKLTGWSVTSFEVRDRKMETIPGPEHTKPLGMETGAAAILVNAPQTKQGGFTLQPYIEAFSDLNRIEILYWMAEFKGFAGLREFENPALSVRLIHAGGPYRYLVEIRDHAGRLPALPVTQAPAAGVQSTRVVTPKQPRATDWSGLVTIMAVAAGSGLFVLIGLLAWSRIRDRSPLHGRTRHVSRP